MNPFLTMTFSKHTHGMFCDHVAQRKIRAILKENFMLTGALMITEISVAGCNGGPEIESWRIKPDKSIEVDLIIYVDGGKKKKYTCRICGKDDQSKKALYEAIQRHCKQMKKVA